MFEQRAGVEEKFLAARFALAHSVASGCRNILDVAQGEPDLPRRYAGRDRLFGGAAAHGIQNHVVREDATVRPELVGHRNPEFTQTHGSTVTGGFRARWRNDECPDHHWSGHS